MAGRKYRMERGPDPAAQPPRHKKSAQSPIVRLPKAPGTRITCGTMKITCSLRRAGAAMLAMAAALLLPSCFESHSTVKVKKDGSGTMEIKMIMGAQMTEMMKMAAQQGGEVKNPLTDEKELKAQTKKMGEGVEFVGVEELKFDDGRTGALATYKFADIRKVKMEPGSGPPGGGEGEDEGKSNSQPVAFDFTPGDQAKLTIKMPPMDKGKDKEAAAPAKEEAKEEDPAAAEGEPEVVEGKDDPSMQMMTKMFEGMKVSMDIEVEGEVSASNATHRAGSKVTLMEIDMGKMMANPDVAKKLKSPEDLQDFAKFARIAKDAGVTIEPQPEITVEFK